MPDANPTPRNACIVGRMTGVGLDRDAALIRTLLEENNLSVDWQHPRDLAVQYHLPLPFKPKYDLIVFLERVFTAWHRIARTCVVIPNQERFPLRHVRRLRNVDAVFCKTEHATEAFAKHHRNARHLSFTSDDRNLPDVKPDYSRFFHLAGHSTLKGTEEVIETWRRNPDWPPLTLVIHPHNAPDSVPDNVELISRRLEEDELLQLQNSCGVHLCPSRSEGWGHYIVEALSCSAITVTTDGPPMNELVTPERGILVPYDHTEPRHLGTNFHVNTNQLESAINRILKTPEEELATLGKHARQWFEDNDRNFRQRFHQLTGELLAKLS